MKIGSIPAARQAVWALVAGLMLTGGTGCEKGYERPEHPEGEEAWQLAHSAQVADEEIVATVDGRAITRGDVAAKWREMPEASAREVVEALVEREVLAVEAKRRGYLERPEVSFGRKQGLVAALLEEEVETQVEVDEQQRAAMLEWLHERWRIPEALRASQLAIVVPEHLEGDEDNRRLENDERQQLFEEALEQMRYARELLDGRVDDDALREVAEQLEEEVLDSGLRAVVNSHLRFPRRGESAEFDQLPSGWTIAEPEFVEAAESVADADSRGAQLSEPARTDEGWHIIRVDEVLEERPVDAEIAEQYADYELRRTAREELLRENIEGWLQGVAVEVMPEQLESPHEH